ncbi:hypothetical protein B0T22DRAFT_141082 [Podospora appendiculata]|uniref:SET domain-containing protein n=1 Tax=Podospora appendiculata TaxID=314037 RepID=A0AAE1CBY6_9PEZI|nr:hypothetical protein B0T22DRAFT_141082 [Podospora appendiculata]
MLLDSEVLITNRPLIRPSCRAIFGLADQSSSSMSSSGNCFRLLSHDCKSSARFTPKKVSGRYIMVVKALKDIHGGTEITVSYGNGFFGGACSCQTCKLGGRKNAARAMLAES